MKENKRLEEMIDKGYISNDLEPLKCIGCGSSNLKIKVTDTLDGHTVLEQDSICEDCNTINGSWAFGHWQL